ncbi:MAG: TolC family outer membrane protein [Rhodospirillaceae bacterium]|nr:TolC family outer membrane protein [Rhodospirillaceae bacterium]
MGSMRRIIPPCRVAAGVALGALTLLAAAATAPPCAAETLQEALGKAYINNPTLQAARAQLRATDELVPQALSGYRPTVTINGSSGAQSTTNTGGDIIARSSRNLGFSAPSEVDLTVNQPIYRGGGTEASVAQAEATVRAQRAQLQNVEQNVLLQVIVAYLDVLRDQAIVDLDRNNVVVLTRQLQATRDRFEFGEVTKTDVSQAESRLSGAIAERVQAEGQLEASRAVYRQLVGDAPGTLRWPEKPAELPASEAEARSAAEAYNPAVVSAEYVAQAAEHGVDVVAAQLNPQISLQGQLKTEYDPGTQFDNGRTDVGGIFAQVTIPLYQAGETESRVREAKQTVRQRRDQIDEQRRAAGQAATAAWQALLAARAQISAFQDEVKSAQVALEGVRQEQEVGYRTVLDVLNAEQELLTARVNLVRAQHDEIVAAFQVLAAVGRLTATSLGLDVPRYDEKAYYEQVRDKFWGLEPPAVPTAPTQ